MNAEGRIQSFHAVVKPQGETRPAWKVLRVLADLLGVTGLAFDSSQDVLKQVSGTQAGGLVQVPAERLSNATAASISTAVTAGVPCAAAIYALDGTVRRASSLQLTADARQSEQGVAA